jgi:hypothetical protein
VTGTLQDAVDVVKVLGGAVGGGAALRMFQLRAANRLTAAQANVEDAKADATEAHATAELIQAATQTVAAGELQEVRSQVLVLMGQATEDRVTIHTLRAELAAERARNTRTDAYLIALRGWASDAVREIGRLGGTISDPPAPPLDPPTPPVPAPRRPSE